MAKVMQTIPAWSMIFRVVFAICEPKYRPFGLPVISKPVLKALMKKLFLHCKVSIFIRYDYNIEFAFQIVYKIKLKEQFWRCIVSQTFVTKLHERIK
jgi:hypothetical protein